MYSNPTHCSCNLNNFFLWKISAVFWRKKSCCKLALVYSFMLHSSLYLSDWRKEEIKCTLFFFCSVSNKVVWDVEDLHFADFVRIVLTAFVAEIVVMVAGSEGGKMRVVRGSGVRDGPFAPKIKMNHWIGRIIQFRKIIWKDSGFVFVIRYWN